MTLILLMLIAVAFGVACGVAATFAFVLAILPPDHPDEPQSFE